MSRTCSRFDDDSGANNALNDEIPLDPPGNTEIPSDGAQDLPEIMREAPQEGPDQLTDLISNDDPMVVDKDSSPFVQNTVITPPSDGNFLTGQQISGIYVHLTTPSTHGLTDDVGPLNSG
jgi:cohesin complex subunit SCC1